MAAFNACITVGYVAGAAVKGITLDSWRSRPAANWTCAASSASARRCPGLRIDRLRSTIKGDGTSEQFAEIHETVMKTSPNYFNISRPIRTKGRSRSADPLGRSPSPGRASYGNPGRALPLNPARARDTIPIFRRHVRGRCSHGQSQQGTVGEGRLHPHRADHARERRGARREPRHHPGHAGARPRLRRRHHRGAGGPAAAPTCSASTSPRTWSPPATRGRAAAGLDNLRFQEGDAADLAASPTTASTSSSASSARCSRRGRSTSPARWCA